MKEPELDSFSTASSVVTFREVEQFYYEYEPQQDITTYELAVLVPYLGPRVWGREASRKAAVVPATETVSGSTCGGTVLKLSEHDVEGIGGAMRHLRKVDTEMSWLRRPLLTEDMNPNTGFRS